MDVAHLRRGLLVGPTVESFVEFYRHEWRDVVGLGFVLTGDRCVAEDLAQEGFTAAYRRWDHVAAMDKPGAWAAKRNATPTGPRSGLFPGINHDAFERTVMPRAKVTYPRTDVVA